MSASYLWRFPVSEIFVTLILDGNNDVLSVRADCNRIRLATKLPCLLDQSGSNFNSYELTRGVDAVRTSVDPSKGLIAKDSNRGRFSCKVGHTQRLGWEQKDQ